MSSRQTTAAITMLLGTLMAHSTAFGDRARPERSSSTELIRVRPTRATRRGIEATNDRFGADLERLHPTSGAPSPRLWERRPFARRLARPRVDVLLSAGDHHAIRRHAVTTVMPVLAWDPREPITEARRAEIRNRLHASYAHVETSAGSGSGFVATEEGWIVTNHHVVGSDPAGITITVGERTVAAHVIAMSKELDIALLQPVQSLDAPALPIVEHWIPLPGEEVFAYGSPGGFRGTFSRGMVSGVFREAEDMIDPMFVHTTGLGLHPGSSGGPLVNASGAIVGINASIHRSAQSSGFSVASVTLQRFLTTIRQKLAEFDAEP